MGHSELADLEAEIGRTTRRLAATVEELSYRLQPRELSRRTLAGAGQKARGVISRPGSVALGSLMLLGLAAAAAWRLRRR